MARYLVMAHQTAEHPALLDQLRSIADEDEFASFVLLIPATPLEYLRMLSDDAAAAVAEESAVRARTHFGDAGIVLEDVRVSDPHPYVAATEELSQHPEYAAFVISTFPPGISRWLNLDVVSRLERFTDTPIIHVVAEKETAPP